MLKPTKKEILNSWTVTYSGKEIYLLDPKPEYVDIKHIAHALSLICRYGGWCQNQYNVAHHSLLVSKVSEKPYYLHALLHDATEAYCQDIVRPIKHFINRMGYEEIEEKWAIAIGDKFGYDPFEYSHEVKTCDNFLVHTELKEIMGFVYTDEIRRKIGIPETGFRIGKLLTAKQSEKAFLKRFKELTNGKRF